jgi:CBS domain containing-hemolysin-like protein
VQQEHYNSELALRLLGRFPEAGDAVTVSGLELVADRVERRRKRLVTVLVRIVDPS